MADLGRIGETWLEPGRLFDPDDPADAPPADALDVQFRAPLSFSAFVDDLFRTGRGIDAAACLRVYDDAIARTVQQVQRLGGFVLDEHGAPVPARLDLTAHGEATMNGDPDRVRVHHHLYVGRTGVSVRDGRRLPVDVHRLRRGIRAVLPLYDQVLQGRTEDRFGCRWGPPPGGYDFEILDPPMHERITGQEHEVCRSPWGPRTTWEQPSPELLAALDQEAALIARHTATTTDPPQ
ncbi:MULTISPECIES: hypothetical protein [Pseudonocardia]|uniref:hypothetical protein n=1 Tax=Pseudonocardia TaxID=1847 RepID=UPI0013686C1E|nr:MULTISPECIES: hypothetical protein [Pseudonocardia]MYW73608.1 hypothetical protein [Pseudonocardia sp. SID8383]WFG47508.1 hypothetical protein PaSha_28920 [Pseudonocardia alni]